MQREHEGLQRGSSKSVDTSAQVLAPYQLQHLTAPTALPVFERGRHPDAGAVSLIKQAQPLSAANVPVMALNWQQPGSGRDPAHPDRQAAGPGAAQQIVADTACKDGAAALVGHKRPRALSMDLVAEHADQSLPEVRRTTGSSSCLRALGRRSELSLA